MTRSARSRSSGTSPGDETKTLRRCGMPPSGGGSPIIPHAPPSCNGSAFGSGFGKGQGRRIRRHSVLAIDQFDERLRHDAVRNGELIENGKMMVTGEHG